VIDEVPGDLVQALAAGDEVIVALEFPFQALGDVDVVDLQPLQGVSKPGSRLNF